MANPEKYRYFNNNIENECEKYIEEFFDDALACVVGNDPFRNVYISVEDIQLLKQETKTQMLSSLTQMGPHFTFIPYYTNVQSPSSNDYFLATYD